MAVWWFRRMLETFAPAKINLYLHVTGQRADGYHYLDSLVVFASVGDRLRLERGTGFSLAIEGPMASALAEQDMESNLVVKAARRLAEALAVPLDLKLTLIKNLPIASGIGGGSTDAAAALRLLAAYWGLSPEAPLLIEIAAALGQDVPCCLAANTCYFRDIGHITEPGPALPLTHMVLVNPNVSLPTPSVFKARTGPFSKPAPLATPPKTTLELVEALTSRHNDLSEPAISLCPAVHNVLAALSNQPSCLLARMSGSGATCFGLFEDRGSAREAAAKLHQLRPDWWVIPTIIPYAQEPVIETR